MTVTNEPAVRTARVSDDEVAGVLAELAAAASARSGVPVALLDGYPRALLTVARTGRGLSTEQEASCRRLGGQAVAMGVGLPALVAVHMHASRRLWSRLPELLAAVRERPLRPTELVGVGEAVWRAADAALAALTAGYVEAQRLVVRREEEFRREFVDDLLTGRSPIGPLIERAESFGLQLSGGHLVVVVEDGQPIDSGSAVRGSVDEALRARFATRGLLVEAKDGRLVCVVSSLPGGDRAGDVGDQVAELAGRATSATVRSARPRVGIGRPYAGPRGVQRSFQEAMEALETATRLRLPHRVVHAADLLVYRVLGRDEAALADLVRTVLEPLTAARGGAEPLVETLRAYFAAGSNAAEAARRLHLSVRAVTYRLQRVQELTGYSPARPSQHLTLLVAVTGARLLDWPRRRLVSE